MSYDELRNKIKVQLSFYHCKTRKRQIREYSYTREMITTRLRQAEVEYLPGQCKQIKNARDKV